MTKNTPHISLKNIFFGYKKSKKTLIENISFEIPPASIVRLSGPSGSGKTTFLELVGGILFPTQGSVYIGNIQTNQLKKNRFSLFGYAFVDADFFENMSAKDNILMPAKSMNISVDRDWYTTLTQKLGIKQYLQKNLCELSAGQRERVNLIRALVHKPRILILDEPGSHLDETLVGKVIQIILEYFEQEKPTIFISSHQDFTQIHFDFLLSFYEDSHLSIETNTKPQNKKS